MLVSGVLFQHKHNIFAITILCCFVLASLSFLKEVIVVETKKYNNSSSNSNHRSSHQHQQQQQRLRIPVVRHDNSGVVVVDNNADAVVPAATMVGDNNTTATSTTPPTSTASSTKSGSESSSPSYDDVDDNDNDIYTHPVPELLNDHLIGNNINDNNIHLPIPLQVMEQYIDQHSVDSLRRTIMMNPNNDDDGISNRKYSVVFYSCPIQAGNRLHHYLTGMLWSILTNRTMLWKYWDTPTCQKYGRDFSQAICTSSNNVSDCDSILHRAPWIPSYDEFAPLLGLDADADAGNEPYELPFYSTHPASIVNGRYKWGPGNNDVDSYGVDVKFQDKKVVVFAQTRFKISFMAKKQTRDMLLHSEWARQRCEQLYQLGADFLFGMLHRYSFDLSSRIKKGSVPERANSITIPSNAYSVALHSRHIDPDLDGCDISREQHCMNQLFNNHNSKENGNHRRPPCVVMLMSDRECTLSRLKPWLESLGCEVVVASHSEAQTDYLGEHGPFAGAGYFQDLALASKANSAFIGLSRSSSDLILELIEFNRKMGLWRKANYGEIDPLNNIDKCRLKKIIPSKRIERMPSRDKPVQESQQIQEAGEMGKQMQQQKLEEGEMDAADAATCSCMNPAAAHDCCQRVI